MVRKRFEAGYESGFYCQHGSRPVSHPLDGRPPGNLLQFSAGITLDGGNLSFGPLPGTRYLKTGIDLFTAVTLSIILASMLLNDSYDLSILGCGAVGTSLARALHRAGFPVRSILSRRSSHELPEDLRAVPCFDSFRPDPKELGTFIFVTVPDDQIEEVARDLATIRGTFWSGRYVIHCSGFLGSEVLVPLAEQGAKTAAFHPIQTFPADASADRFSGITISLEGTAELTTILADLATSFGSKPIVLSNRQKKALHLAAVYLSNYLVVLGDLADELIRENIEGADCSILHPLLMQTAKNLRIGLPQDVLTGPVSRGDLKTVSRHLELLEQEGKDTTLYRQLGLRAIELVEKRGSLSEADITEMKKCLQEI